MPLDAVQVGNILRVRPGEKVPVDGVVVDGGAACDEAMVTGESIPVDKRPGDRVIGGAVAPDGTFTMRAQRRGAQTPLPPHAPVGGGPPGPRAPIQRPADP